MLRTYVTITGRMALRLTETGYGVKHMLITIFYRSIMLKASSIHNSSYINIVGYIQHDRLFMQQQ